ncbi:MAG: hypothetical protein ABI835_20130, partial [Chloroflexota bacterium]
MSQDRQNLSRRKFIKLGTASAAGIASAGVIAASLIHQTPVQAQTDGGMGDMPAMDMGTMMPDGQIMMPMPGV